MPRPAPTIRVTPTVRPAVRARRPPAPFIDALLKPEGELRERIQEIEGSELFRRLVRTGAVARRGLRGRIPRSAYEDYMQRQFVEFLREHDIDGRGDWRTDFLQQDALRRLPELARRYGVPPAELARFIRYLRSMSAAPAEGQGGGGLEGHGPDVADYAPGGAEVDVSEAAEIAQEFVERYGVTQTEFIADFIHGDGDPDELAARYGADTEAVRRVLDAVDAIQIADAATGAPPLTPAPARPVSQEPEEQVIAWVEPDEAADGVAMGFHEAAGYALHYRIDPTALEEGETDADVQELLDELRWINQRRSLVSRLAAFLATYQTRFFRTGEPLHLRPISQAEAARQLGEHQSSVCRAIRDKYVESPHGVFALQFLCQGTGDVVRRIAADDPSLSDSQIRERLRVEYECDVSRRTVNYHRRKAASGEREA